MTQNQREQFVQKFFEQVLRGLDGYPIHHIECHRHRTSAAFTITVVSDGLAELTFQAEWEPPHMKQELLTREQKLDFLKAMLKNVSLGGYPVDHIELEWVYDDGSFTIMVVADWGAELKFTNDWKGVLLPGGSDGGD